MARDQFDNRKFKYPFSTKTRDFWKGALNDYLTIADIIDPTATQSLVNGTQVTTPGNMTVSLLTAASLLVTPGVPFVLTWDYPDAATANYDSTVLRKLEVIDVTVIKNGAGAGNTVQLFNGVPTAITDAIVAATDKAVTRMGTCDRTANVIAAGGTLRTAITRAAGSGAAKVHVLVVHRA